MKVSNREIHVNEKIMETFAKISRPINEVSLELILEMDEVKIASLSDEELDKAVEDALLKELSELEKLSREETISEAIAAATSFKK
jgi:hypothetical protein